MKKIIGIYKITSPTNRIYIGSSNDIYNRWCSYKNLKCKSQTKLYNSLLKYGAENHIFEIIEKCSIEYILKKELYYGTLFNVLDKSKGLNCRLPKSMDNYSYMSIETKRKIGAANKGKGKGMKKEHYESKLKKLTVLQVREIKLLLIENKLTQKEIGLIYNVTRETIGGINLGNTYRTISNDINLDLRKKKYVKLEVKDYEIIKQLNKEGMSQKKIAIKFNVDQSHVSRIINNPNYIKSYELNKEGEVNH